MATLYTWSGNTNGQAVQSAAKLANIDLTVKNFVPGTAPDSFPSHCTAPVLKTKEGENLTQLSAILSYVNGSSDVYTTEWIGFAETILTPGAQAWVFPTLGAMPNNKGVINEGKQRLLAALEHLNEALSTRTFLIGEKPSAADAANVAALSLAFKQVLSEEYRQSIPHVVRWFQTCIHQPEFNSFGSIPLCEKEASFDGKIYGEINKKGKGGNDKKDNSNKQGGKKDAKPKQQQPKKEKAPKKEEPAEAAPAVAAPAKKKDPWAGMPGTYDFDAWKRCYSNNDTIPVAMDYFWKNLDKENYSCYYGKYMYADEIQMSFMASNLVRGMFQRLDKMRKNAFSSVIVFDLPEGGLEISGVWFWKGQGLAFDLDDDWKVDYDTYEWKKLNFDCEEDKATIQKYFAWEGDFGGKKVADGKVYK